MAVWFDGRWILAMQRNVWTDTDEGWVTSTPVVTSTDGRDWTAVESGFPEHSATSISVGPASMIATQCNFGGDSFWYSDDGIDWQVTATAFLGHRSMHVDGLGFLTYYQGSLTAFSPDGLHWQGPPAELTVRRVDTGSDLAGTNLFVSSNRLMRWSIDDS